VANKDLRDWIGDVEAAGELKTIKGAEPKEEIGGIVDIYMRKMGNPPVMFDEVPGFPRATACSPTSSRRSPRVNMTLGLPPEATEMEQIQWWRNYFKDAPMHPTKAVNGGPLLDNVLDGQGRRHRQDSDAGLARARRRPSSAPPAMVVMKDPDTGWINYGTYRVQAHEPNARQRDDVSRASTAT
jgi:3-polyprenyl-4-hydroxybenzoate decarboxylase